MVPDTAPNEPRERQGDDGRPEMTIGPDSAGERLDQFVARRRPGLSRSAAQKLIASGDILVNGRSAGKSERLAAGDVVSVKVPRILDGGASRITPQDIPLTILYEDEYLVAIDKPAGLVVHPGSGTRDGTLVNALVHRIASLSEGFAADRPGIVHRLDKETSGVLLAAKTNAAHAALASLFMQRKIEKQYVGFCIGRPRADHATIDLALARSRRDPTRRAPSHDGKEARTEYWVLAHRSGISAMRFRPYTGRTHQIRVHCSSSGFPIVADTVYGGGRDCVVRLTPADRPFAYSIFKCFDRHALHALVVRFAHPFTGSDVRITAPPPGDFVRAELLFGAGPLFTVE